MMTRSELVRQIQAKKSVLCVGLDPDLAKIPQHLLLEEDPIFAFNKAIIDATHEFAVAYKPNIAFYESLGVSGWTSLRKTLDYIPKECFTIADAKRGDIGNTSAMYARTFFFTYEFDSVTVNPYMGSDSVMPFLGFDGKWAIVLGLTSNPGAEDFQYFNSGEMHLYERVLDKLKSWGTEDNIMVVVGATVVTGEMVVSGAIVVVDVVVVVSGVGGGPGTSGMHVSGAAAVAHTLRKVIAPPKPFAVPWFIARP